MITVPAHCPCGKPRISKHCFNKGCPWNMCTDHVYDNKGRKYGR